MTEAAGSPEVQVTVRGDVPERDIAYAREKVARVTRHTRQPVLYAHTVLTREANPAQERPAVAEAGLDLNGTPIRARVSAELMREAIDLLDERLRRRIDQYEGRLERRHRWIGTPEQAEWRRGMLPTQRPEYFPRPVDEREVVRRKTFALTPITADEAAFDMEMLGHDFYLYTDLDTGRDAVVHRLADGGYGLSEAEGPDGPTSRPGLEVGPPPPTLSDEEARERLDAADEPFVFYLDPAGGGRGRVVYRRYDGHYGLITAAA